MKIDFCFQGLFPFCLAFRILLSFLLTTHSRVLQLCFGMILVARALAARGPNKAPFIYINITIVIVSNIIQKPSISQVEFPAPLCSITTEINIPHLLPSRNIGHSPSQNTGCVGRWKITCFIPPGT